MEVILNIGLAVGTNGNIGVGTVLRDLAEAGFSVIENAVHYSDSEPTVVARAIFVGTEDALRNAAEWVSLWLSQDCIAFYNPTTDRGALIGPRADAWGEFNPEFFIQIDGSRLAAPTLARAA
jgi:hypothetical protein